EGRVRRVDAVLRRGLAVGPGAQRLEGAGPELHLLGAALAAGIEVGAHPRAGDRVGAVFREGEDLLRRQVLVDLDSHACRSPGSGRRAQESLHLIKAPGKPKSTCNATRPALPVRAPDSLEGK